MQNYIIVKYLVTFLSILLCLQRTITCQNINLAKFYAETGNCKFYEEVDKLKSCGSSGYPLAHGFRYCNKFIELYSTFDADGQSWSMDVRKCLMDMLFANLNNLNSCDALREYAFDTHVPCYVKPTGKSFCSVVKNNLHSLAATYHMDDFLTPNDLKQALLVTYDCAKAWAALGYQSAKDWLATAGKDALNMIDLFVG